MSGVCAFAVFLFLLSVASVGLLLRNKDELLRRGESSHDELEGEMMSSRSSLTRDGNFFVRENVSGKGEDECFSYSTDL